MFGMAKKYAVSGNDKESRTIRMYFENAIHYPTLKTVIEVENVLKNSGKPLIKADIKKKLKTKIMHQTLNIILAYLMERNMIINTSDGFVWIYSPEAVRRIYKKIKSGKAIKLEI